MPNRNNEKKEENNKNKRIERVLSRDSRCHGKTNVNIPTEICNVVAVVRCFIFSSIFYDLCVFSALFSSASSWVSTFHFNLTCICDMIVHLKIHIRHFFFLFSFLFCLCMYFLNITLSSPESISFVLGYYCIGIHSMQYIIIFFNAFFLSLSVFRFVQEPKSKRHKRWDMRKK